jgi:uncharacterized protein (TIGR01777 family)
VPAPSRTVDGAVLTSAGVRVAITGSSGLIGTALRARLVDDGHDVVRIVRGAPSAGDIAWDAAGELDPAALTAVDAVVNLAGAGIGDHRWTDDTKREVRDSRVRTTAALSRAMVSAQPAPAVLLSGSGIGFYGDRGDDEVDESSSSGSGFLAVVCGAWEAATHAAATAGVRVVHLRTGIVLSRDGGALKKQLPLFRFGLGGRFGNGRQWQSWISITDEIGAIVHLLTSDVSGPVNLVAPAPVTNREFAATLARVLGRPAFLPIPSIGPKLVLGAELADTLLFEGQRVIPRVLRADGYTFEHGDLETALRSLLA